MPSGGVIFTVAAPISKSPANVDNDEIYTTISNMARSEIMEFVILGLLLLKNQTIYDLNKSFSEIISLFYRASYGSLRTTLSKLKDNNMVYTLNTVENGRKKTYYEINQKGISYFYEWMESDLTSIKTSLMNTKLFFLDHIKDNSIKLKIVTNLYDLTNNQNKDLIKLNQSIMMHSKDETSEGIIESQYLTLGLGLVTTKAVVKYLESIMNTYKNK